MPDIDFRSLYQQTLQTVEEILDHAINDDLQDIDYELSNDILKIECQDGSQIIITPQAAIGQLWLAARSGGFHYNYDDEAGVWRFSEDGKPFGQMLSEICQFQGSVDINFEGL